MRVQRSTELYQQGELFVYESPFALQMSGDGVGAPSSQTLTKSPDRRSAYQTGVSSQVASDAAFDMTVRSTYARQSIKIVGNGSAD